LVGYNAGGENGCPSVPLLPPVLHCPFRRKKVKGGLRPFLSAVLADRQVEAHTADKKQALDCLPPTLPKSPKRK
jgi:hypothetical protein